MRYFATFFLAFNQLSCECCHEVKRGKPYQSCLKAYTDEIMNLRMATPRKTYREIAQIMKDDHGLDVTINAVWSFVTRRTNIKRILKRAQSLDVIAQAPTIDTSSLRAKIRASSEVEPQPKEEEWKQISDL